MKNRKRGFTLIELLVVISIIGLLSSVVLANLNSARQKSRDVKRIADVKQLQLALELYFDANAKYPGILADLAPTYISVIPTPPTGVSGVTAYNYVPLGTACNNFHLGSALELSSNTVLTNDSDATAAGSVGSNCGGSAVTASADFTGTSLTCSATTGADQCFDVTP